MLKKVAIIDCGTNTFHLLIALINGSNHEVIFSEKISVRVGKGGINKGSIEKDAENRAINTLSHFREKIDEHQVALKDVHAFATSAFRNATNKIGVTQHILDRTGIEINIISGEEEARLIYNGVISAVTVDNEPNLVVDIGGGSVEFIIGRGTEILWLKSFEVGAQRLLDQFHKHDPILPEEIIELENYLSQSLSELVENIQTFKPLTLIGSSGTFDTLSDIYREMNGIHIEQNSSELPLTFDVYHQIHQLLLSKDKEQRLSIPGMIEMRADMIVVASCLINWLIKQYTFGKIQVSTYSLKEGVLSLIKKGLL